MKKTTHFIGLLFLAVGMSLGMRITANAQTASSAQLVAASRSARIRVNPAEYFSITQGKETFSAAPAAGWENIPPTAMRNGVTIGFAYFSTEDPKIPRGYYPSRPLLMLRKSAPWRPEFSSSLETEKW